MAAAAAKRRLLKFVNNLYLLMTSNIIMLILIPSLLLLSVRTAAAGQRRYLTDLAAATAASPMDKRSSYTDTEQLAAELTDAAEGANGSQLAARANGSQPTDMIVYEDDETESEKQFRIATMIVNSVIYTVGLCGNSVVILIILRLKKIESVTDVYILNLAVADLTFIAGLLPLVITTHNKSVWIFGPMMCKIFMSLTSLNQFASSLLLVVMSFDRYLAVCHPIFSHQYRQTNKAKSICCIIWLICFVLMVPILVYSKVDKDRNVCDITWPEYHINLFMLFTLYSFILGFALPVTLIAIFYYCLIRKLRNRMSAAAKGAPTTATTTVSNASNSATQNATTTATAAAIAAEDFNSNSNSMSALSTSKRVIREHANRRIEILIMTIICTYTVCWLPYWIMQYQVVSCNTSQGGNSTSFPEVIANQTSSELGGQSAEATTQAQADQATLRQMQPQSPDCYTTAFFQAIFIATSLSYLNSALNPILYAFLGDNFKKRFQDLFKFIYTNGAIKRNQQKQNSSFNSKYNSRVKDSLHNSNNFHEHQQSKFQAHHLLEGSQETKQQHLNEDNSENLDNSAANQLADEDLMLAGKKSVAFTVADHDATVAIVHRDQDGAKLAHCQDVSIV